MVGRSENMGAKGFGMCEIIKSALEREQEPKTGQELKDIVKNELNSKHNYPKEFMKGFNGALLKLLEASDIKLVGYSPSVDKRTTKQAFKSEPLIFDLSKRSTRPDIQEKLNNIYKDNEAYQYIREKFKKRASELRSFEKDRWDRLKRWAIYFTPKDIRAVLSKSININELENKINSLESDEKNQLNEWYSFEERLEYSNETEKSKLKLNNYFYDKMSNSKLFKELQQLLKDNINDPDSTVEFFLEQPVGVSHLYGLLNLLQQYEDQKNVKFWTFPIGPKDFENIWSMGSELIQDGTPTKDYFFQNSMSIIFNSYNIDVSGSLDVDKVLDSAGFQNHYKEDNFGEFFEYTIDILSTYPKSDKEILFGILAKCLSDEIGSLETFHDFYVKIQKVTYGSRLSTVLKIFEA